MVCVLYWYVSPTLSPLSFAKSTYHICTATSSETFLNGLSIDELPSTTRPRRLQHPRHHAKARADIIWYVSITNRGGQCCVHQYHESNPCTCWRYRQHDVLHGKRVGGGKEGSTDTTISANSHNTVSYLFCVCLNQSISYAQPFVWISLFCSNPPISFHFESGLSVNMECIK